MTFAEKAISFFSDLRFSGTLPNGILIMNPYRENPDVIPVVKKFFLKFYNDNKPRHIVIGINPGRFGAGQTGITFTDTIRLAEQCGIVLPGIRTFETSSAFIYEMIGQYGGPEIFFSDFYLTAVSPLGFTKEGKGRQVNYNYYDNAGLIKAVSGFIRESVDTQLKFGIQSDAAFCLGTGKNYRFLKELNNEKGYFREIVPLEHPRFIMQYKSKQKQYFVSKYIEEFRKVI